MVNTKNRFIIVFPPKSSGYQIEQETREQLARFFPPFFKLDIVSDRTVKPARELWNGYFVIYT
jgi:hypothetical protein